MESEESHERNSPTPGPDDLVFDVDRDTDTGRISLPLRISALTREEYENRHKRLVIAMVAVIFFVLIGNGVGWTLYADTQYNACADRNARAASAGKALSLLENASKDDGDPNQARVWRQYRHATETTPLPKCEGKAFWR